MFYDDINVITHFPVASISQCFLNADLKNDKVFWVRILEMCFNCHYKKILIVLKIGFIFFIKRYFPICIESSTFFVSSLCLAHFSHCQLYDFCIVLIFKNLLVSLFIFNIYLDLSCIIMAFILFCIWLVSHSCAVYTCHMKCVFVCVCVHNASLYQQKHYYKNWIMTQCLPIMLFGTTVLSGVNAFALSAHLGSVLVRINLISDQPTLLHDTAVYFDMVFIACTVFSLFYIPLIILTLVYDLCFPPPQTWAIQTNHLKMLKICDWQSLDTCNIILETEIFFMCMIL